MVQKRLVVTVIVCAAVLLTNVYIFVDVGQFGIPSSSWALSTAASSFQPEPPFANSSSLRQLAQKYRSSQNGTEIRQVVFAKVHKAASSTMQNILLRFAMARDLDVLLPALNSGPILSQTESYIDPAKIIAHTRGKPFDILCSHVLYDANEIAKYFRDDAARVAILREPMSQTLSALTYYTTMFPSEPLKAGLKKHPHDPINGFISHPEQFYYEGNNTKPALSFINNRMSIDLGFDLRNFSSSKSNRTKIQAFIKDIDDEFDVVLISDYFDESMVLLRRLLHWSIKDIIYIKVNAVQKNRNTLIWQKAPILNSTQKHSFRQWAAIDYALYEHFLPIFQDKIRKEPYFEEEVETYKAIQREVHTFCLQAIGQSTLAIPKNVWTEQFTVSKSECNLMLTSEVKLIDTAKRSQLRRYRSAQQPPYMANGYKG